MQEICENLKDMDVQCQCACTPKCKHLGIKNWVYDAAMVVCKREDCFDMITGHVMHVAKNNCKSGESTWKKKT